MTSEHDDKEVEAFFDAYQQKVLGYVRGMGLDFHEAEDVVNTCFVAIWRYWDTICEGDLGAFLYVVARNEVYKRLRTRRRRPEDLHAQLEAPATRDYAQQVADHEALCWALDRLSHREREAVLLRYYVGCDIAETARIMGGIGQGTVKRYASDGCRKLRQALASEPEEARKGVAQ